MIMGTVTWDIAPSFPAVLLTMLVSLVVGGAASYAFYLWLDKTDETAGGCATVQTVIAFVAAFTLLFGNSTMGEHSVNVSELAHVGRYDGTVTEAKYADVKIETRYGAVVEMPREALGEDAAAGDKATVDVYLLPGGDDLPWYASRSEIRQNDGWVAGYKGDGAIGLIVSSGACAAKDENGYKCAVTYRQAFSGGNGYYLIQVSPAGDGAQ